MPNVALLPVTRDPQQLVTYIEENFRRIAAAMALPVPAASVTPGAFPTGAFTVDGDLTVTGKIKFTSTTSRAAFWEGLELGHPSSVPYIDFHKSSNPDEAEDFRWRIILGYYDSKPNELQIRYRDDPWGRVQLGNVGVGAYGWDNTYANIGHRDRMDVASDSYQFLARSDGEILVNSSNSRYALFRYNAGERIRLQSSGIAIWSWLRSQDNDHGWYHEVHGGGWHMNDGWLRAYGGKGIYTSSETRGGDGRITTWQNSGGHAYAGGQWSIHDGYMERWDGWLWLCAAGWLHFRIRGGDVFTCDNSGGWADLRANLAWITGTDVIIAGSNQLGRNASSRTLKHNIREQKLGRNNPIWKLKPKRFKWDEEKVMNGKEVNKRNPDGVYGLIAEEVAELMPEAVHPDPYDPTRFGIDRGAVMAFMLDAMQDLAERVGTLEGKAK